MSEGDIRPPPTRGRGAIRGGRGGFGRGGPRGGRKSLNGTSNPTPTVDDSLDDQGELGEMKKKYLSELSMLKELFPDWTDVDLVFALQEADGDVPSTVDKITQGNVSQFAEVKKSKDRARSKAKDEPGSLGGLDKPNSSGRLSRGRGGLESSRGGRGRGSERGRGRDRGGRGGHATTNGATKEGGAISMPTNESAAWSNSLNTEGASGSWDDSVAEALKPTGGSSQPADVAVTAAKAAASSSNTNSSLPSQNGPKKTWASMLKPVLAPVVKKIAQRPSPKETTTTDQVLPGSEAEPAALNEEPAFIAGGVSNLRDEGREVSSGDEGLLVPSQDPLTEENVEHLPDESVPPATQTVASTAGSLDPRNLTPLPGQQFSATRPALGGYATAANRLAGTGTRSASYQRRVQEQQEAVVMPGHNAVNQATVQFGSMGLSSDPSLDVDEDREEAETRQPPQHSPPSQPRATLPPMPRQSSLTEGLNNIETLSTPKQAPGLPPASAQNQQQIQEGSLGQSLAPEAQTNQAYNQYGRYAQSGMHQDSSMQQQKQYDMFNHQTQQSQFDQYGGHVQPHLQQQSQSGFGSLSSASNDYSSYYTSDAPRNAYNQYYGSSYGPQDVKNQALQAQQDVSAGQQRSASGFNAGQYDSAPGSQTHQQAQSRFGDVPGSGNNTPNPPMGGQQQSAPQAPQAQQSQHPQHLMNHNQQQQGGYAGGAGSAYPYGHPYYTSPYQQAYQSQFGYNHQLSGYGGGYPNKQGGMYGGPHGYGMGSQSSYDQHSSSPANTGGFSQNQQGSMRSSSGMGTGIGSGYDEYGRAGSQSSSMPQNSGFSGINDPFARSGSGFGGQGTYSQQGLTAGSDDALKPYGDSKTGASPALGQPGRPGSATNSTSGTGQSGLPPPQGQQSGFAGGYSNFPGQGSQYGGLGGLGNHQSGQGGQGSYGSYGSSGFNQSYGSYGGSRGGWGQNYGVH